MEKKLVNKSIYNKIGPHPFKWKDVKNLQLEDEDVIIVHYVEYWENGRDNSGGEYYEIDVHRMILETNEEFEKRKIYFEELRKESKEKRYESYLKLKKEFEQTDFAKQLDNL